MDVMEIISATEKRISELRDVTIFPGLTAMGSRHAPSHPAKLAMHAIDLRDLAGIDMGCGKSRDSYYLEKKGARKVYRYDPFHVPLGIDIVPGIDLLDFALISYVLNVLPPAERALVAKCTVDVVKPGGVIVVGVREDVESIQRSWKRHEDGHMTGRGTFQTFFTPGDASRIEMLFPGTAVKRLAKGTWMVTKP
jgi:hypothetical protein